MIERFLQSLRLLVESNPVNTVVQRVAYGPEEALQTQFDLDSPLLYYVLAPSLASGPTGYTALSHRLYSLVQYHIKEINPDNTSGNYNGALTQFSPVSEEVQSFDAAHRAFLTVLNAQDAFLFNNAWAVRTVSSEYTAAPVSFLQNALWFGYVYEYTTLIKEQLICDYVPLDPIALCP